MRTSIRAIAFVAMWVEPALAGEAREDTPEIAYHYVSLDAALPSEFIVWQPRALTDDDRIYGVGVSSCTETSCEYAILEYRDGTITDLGPGVVYTVNEHHLIGGSVVVDPVNFIEQAALFRPGQEVELIPPLPDEYTSFVLRVNNRGVALVESIRADTYWPTYYLYKDGRVTPLDFGSNLILFIDINDRGIVAGTSYPPVVGTTFRAFRYDPSSGRTTILDPLPTEPDSWGMAINRRGDVLGYSFVAGALERIGVWHKDEFKTCFVEGTPEFPTVSNNLLWNEDGLIVITAANDGQSYVVPSLGVRINLADVSDYLPASTGIVDMNNRGDLIGYGGGGGNFLLERVDCRAH